jgi:hypothetical protein
MLIFSSGMHGKMIGIFQGVSRRKKEVAGSLLKEIQGLRTLHVPAGAPYLSGSLDPPLNVLIVG